MRAFPGAGKPRRLALAAAAALLLIEGPYGAYADVAGGREAFDKGDYAAAIAEWQGPADRGDVEAQTGIGKLYEFGSADLPQDYHKADFWYRKAADQNSTEAQYRLAVIWAVGGDGFPPDLAEAYKWLILAVETHSIWGARAIELKPQFDQLVGPKDQAEGRKRAGDWKEARAKKEVPTGAAEAVAPTVIVAPNPKAKCEGWPFPTLPCTQDFPAFPGTNPSPRPPPVPANGAAGQSAAPAPAAAAAPEPTATPSIDQLNKALSQIDCSSLRAVLSPQGTPIVSGAISEPAQRAQLPQLVQRFFPGGKAELAIDLVPPPLCRSLVELNALRNAKLIGDTVIGVKLASGSTQLREGDPIRIEIRGPAYPVYVSVDYFSLGGQVLHLWPNEEEPTVKLAAGATSVYGAPGAGKTWNAGGAPFGTELIAVLATPAPLDFGAARRPAVEQAADYLRSLKTALSRSNSSILNKNLLATLLVHTSGR